MLEHPVAREMFQRASGKVGSGAHHQQVREVVVIQFLYELTPYRAEVLVLAKKGPEIPSSAQS